MYGMAQYLVLDLDYPDLKSKVEKYVTDVLALVQRKTTVEMYRLVEEIQPMFTFGIDNKVTVLDQHYSLEDWKQTIQRGIDNIQKNPHRNQTVIDSLRQQLVFITNREEAGEDLSKPIPETISLEFHPWSFFPDTQK